MPEPAIADAIVAKLAVHLGPNVARIAVMLKVMIGQGPSEVVVADIERMAAAK